jgi:hypothetical protein
MMEALSGWVRPSELVARIRHFFFVAAFVSGHHSRNPSRRSSAILLPNVGFGATLQIQMWSI